MPLLKIEYMTKVGIWKSGETETDFDAHGIFRERLGMRIIGALSKPADALIWLASRVRVEAAIGVTLALSKRADGHFVVGQDGGQ